MPLVTPDALALPAQYGLVGLLLLAAWKLGPHFVTFIKVLEGLRNEQTELRRDIQQSQTELRGHMDRNTQRIVEAIERGKLGAFDSHSTQT